MWAVTGVTKWAVFQQSGKLMMKLRKDSFAHFQPPPYAAVAPETACRLSCGSGKGGLAGK